VPAGYGLNLLSSERHHFARAFFRRRRLLGIDMDLHGNWSAICDGQTTWENYGWGWHPGAAALCMRSHGLSERRHTAREQQTEARITYRFHPRFGETVSVR
jgi:hypothetical protein